MAGNFWEKFIKTAAKAHWFAIFCLTVIVIWGGSCHWLEGGNMKYAILGIIALAGGVEILKLFMQSSSGRSLEE